MHTKNTVSDVPRDIPTSPDAFKPIAASAQILSPDDAITLHVDENPNKC